MEERGIVLGSFDMFHVGHVRALRRAAELCRSLTIAVASDELVARRAGRSPMIPERHRVEIVESFGLGSVVLVDDDALESLRRDVGAAIVIASAEPGSEPVDTRVVDLVVGVASTESERVLDVVGRAALWSPALDTVAA